MKYFYYETVHPFLYRALKITFPWDIGGISHDDFLKTEMVKERGSRRPHLDDVQDGDSTQLEVFTMAL